MMQQTEATQTDFYALVRNKQSSWCKNCAMSSISWGEAAAYCNALSKQQGLTPCYSCKGSDYDISCATAAAYRQGNTIYGCPGYRLPTEAEWEYAYRAGTTTAFYNGLMPSNTSCDACKQVPALDAIAWYCANGGYTFPSKGVAAKQPNPWGLYDMAGNAWEWCHDGFVASLGDKRRVDPLGTTGDGYHVHRGGAVWYLAKFARAATRGKSNSSHGLGVRCVRSLKP
jgi:formylglycine-generating enzyme required for sulfatase activity